MRKWPTSTPEKPKTFQVEPMSPLFALYRQRNRRRPEAERRPAAKQIGPLIKSLYDADQSPSDMSLVEINPLVVTKDGNMICLDAKLNFDDNALYRHKDIQALRDLDEEDPAEVEARQI